jgi:phosphatidylserine decarboxylase
MIAPEGWPFVLVPLCTGLAAVALGWEAAGAVLIAAALFGLYFFRNPHRSCAAGHDIACSPADGKVITIGDSPPELTERGLPKQISIFMSPLNVHVNRAPIDGALIDYSYNPGRKISAFKDKASLENEQNLSVWRGSSGTIALKQIAGFVARRIVFDHAIDDEVARGDRIGLIRYGSRVDVFLPAAASILVTLNQRVRAGETPIARMVGQVTS